MLVSVDIDEWPNCLGSSHSQALVDAVFALNRDNADFCRDFLLRKEWARGNVFCRERWDWAAYRPELAAAGEEAVNKLVAKQCTFEARVDELSFEQLCAALLLCAVVRPQ